MAFYTSITGLTGAQTELGTIANNVANVGTNGFKRSRVSFGDIISNSPLQNASRTVGSGTAVRAITQQFQQGPIESSDSALDLAISGQGFFAVKGSGGAGAISFTRNGGFGMTPDRYVVDTAGRRLQLFPTTTDGSLLTNDLASTVSARLPLTSGIPQATTGIKLSVNLPADAVIIPDKPIYTATNPYAFNAEDPATFNNSTSVTIYDSLGNPLSANIYYVKTGVPAPGDLTHKWTAHVIVGGAELEIGGTAGIPMQFDPSGDLVNPASAVVFDSMLPAGGGQPLILSLDHGIATTQQSGPFSRAAIEQDGFPSGQLESVSIDASGTLRASFTNGEIQTLGKVAVAIFSNPQGLKQVGDASFVVTPDSGPAITGEAGRNGIGSILSGSLERSNVDLTVELVGLIAAQRNFQANAKALETDTTLLQTIINLR
ncbi:flagellar hook protein FlgE [Polymorphobacter glacialis]|uniref:Flagellar hook protein FlgE n=1 Tax=Sandarakinorhabdus glacialis TaxID=1614636 RepID=A0A916ZLE1_9SPHN|nr:flagellar hook protein FlgE [Polymorphobacter glacialis]GGE02218.1 flagellar hook protein FlgE [Polymorphobacter glacialis]